jgi:hypothetical protein
MEYVKNKYMGIMKITIEATGFLTNQNAKVLSTDNIEIKFCSGYSKDKVSLFINKKDENDSPYEIVIEKSELKKVLQFLIDDNEKWLNGNNMGRVFGPVIIDANLSDECIDGWQEYRNCFQFATSGNKCRKCYNKNLKS